MREACARGRWCACALLALLALTVAERDKRTETEHMAPNPFMFVARYGRSSPPRVAPRNDRFFYPRYGKRSGPIAVSASETGPQEGVEGCAADLLCEYTGVYPLYRCRHKLTRRSAEEPGEELE